MNFHTRNCKRRSSLADGFFGFPSANFINLKKMVVWKTTENIPQGTTQERGFVDV